MGIHQATKANFFNSQENTSQCNTQTTIFFPFIFYLSSLYV
jgi:hypothetical protein